MGCCISGGRWTISCVEQGEAYYSKNIGSDDVCGRSGWAQAPIAGTGQFYPRDFSIFTLGDPQNPNYAGDASGIQDVQGPVAVQGTLTTSSFRLNYKTAYIMPVAVVANAALNLTSGTVYGNAYYGTTNNGFPNVTFATSPPVKMSKQLIDFKDAANRLQAMSAALKRYTESATSVPNNNGRISLTGSDPELNAFKVSSSALTGAYDFVINVPQGSIVIINVTGSNPAIYGAGFTRMNNLSPSSMLWNFPDATSLKIQSVGFVGSILAPFAEAELKWGSIDGTVVARKAVPTWIELHWAPFEFPVTRGCLDRDPGWSCSNETKIDDSGRALSLAAEAGFLQIDGGSYVSEGYSRNSPTHRVWYSFRPASVVTPESMPVAVLFNGGPGAATSAGLFSFNTGPWTLDPLMVGTNNAVYTPANSWTKYFNLLYIDAPGTGFSYILPAPDGSRPSVGIDMYRDAAVVARVIVRFLDRHPGIRGNPVVVVAESYGGDRTTIMLDQIFNYWQVQPYPGSNSQYRDQPYFLDMVNHFSAVFGPNNMSAATIAQQFGHQVLIQPNVLGYYQYVSGFVNDTSHCTNTAAGSYNCGQAPDWYLSQLVAAANNLTHINNGTLRNVLGVDPRYIYWLNSSARALAYGRGVDSTPINASNVNELTGVFRSLLSSDDNYYIVLNPQVTSAYSDVNSTATRYSDDKTIAQRFVGNVKLAKTFITHADLDQVIASMEIRAGLEINENLLGLSYVSSASEASSGWITLKYQPNNETHQIRFPEYTDAGHSVSMAKAVGVLAAPTLLADIQQWF